MTNLPGDGQPDDAARAVWGAMRIGDADRGAAMEALAEHLTVGRLTLDEYGDRTAQVSVARTVDELAVQFADLPAPHPVLSPHLAVPQTGPVAAAGAQAVVASAAGTALEADRRSHAQKIVAAAASVSVFVAVALFFLTGSWLWFLLIPGISGVAKAVWGTDWNDDQRRREIERGHH